MNPGQVAPSVEIDYAPVSAGDVLLKEHHMTVANGCGTGVWICSGKEARPIPGEI